jgi:hypothetical protein
MFQSREDLYSNALNLIINRPFLGYGVGHFDSIFNIYSHNFVLDLMLNGGIVLLILFFILMFNSIKKIVLSNNLYLKILGVVFLTLWFPKLYFSTSYLYEPSFWLFLSIGFVNFKNTQHLKKSI